MAAITVVWVLIVLSASTTTTFLCKEINNHLKILTCTLAVKLSPSDAEVVFQRGQASFALGEIYQSIDYFSKAIALDATRAELYEHRSQSYTRRRQYDLALEDLITASKLNVPTGQHFTILGELLEATQQITKAELAYEAALKRAPDSLPAKVNYARVIAHLGKTEQALSILDEVIKSAPRSGYAYATRGDIWRAQKASTKMLNDYAAAIKLDYIPAIAMRAQYFQQKGELEKSINDYTNLIKRSLDKSAAYYRRAEVRFEAGDYINALKDYSTVKRLNKEHAGDARHGQLRALRRLGRHDSVITESTLLLRENPGDWIALFERGRAYKEISQTTDAIKDFSDIIRMYPDFGPAFYQRALSYLSDDQTDGLQLAIADADTWASLDPLNTQARLFRGQLRALNGQHDLAIDEFSFVIQREPSKVSALKARGESYLRLEREAAALSDFSSAIELGLQDAEVFFDRGSIWLSRESFDYALSDFETALRIDPRNEDHLFFRAVTLIHLSRYDEAILGATDLINLNPSSAGSFTLRAMGHFFKGESKSALRDLNRAIRLDRSDPVGWLYRAEVHNRLGQSDRAMSDVAKALSLSPIEPQRAQALYLRGNLNYERGDIEAAEVDHLAALAAASTPRTSSEHRLKGLMYAAVERYSEAQWHLEEAVKRDPQRVQFLTTLADFFVETRRYEDALDLYRRALLIDPRHVDSLSGKAVAYHLLEQFDLSIQTALEALSLDSEHRSANSILKLSLEARYSERYLRGDYDGAVIDITRLLKLDPDDIEARAFRGHVWDQMGRYRRAIDDLTVAIQAAPDNPDFFFSRGLARYSAGQLDGAINDYKSGLRLGGDDGIRSQFLKYLIKEKDRNAELKKDGQQPTDSFNRRIALVIGNSDYKYFKKLQNPASDIALISEAFKSSGFDEVYIERDLSRDNLLRALRDFSKRAASSSWAVIYYAGHGVEVDGLNFIVPIDAPISDVRSFSDYAVSMFEFTQSAEGASELPFLIFDACRDNPFDQSIGGQTQIESFRTSTVAPVITTKRSPIKSIGLARIEPNPGMLITFSAKSGQRALDGSGKYSPFASAFANRISEKPGAELRRLVAIVSEDVLNRTNQMQQPFSYGSPDPRKDFYFAKN